MYFGLYNGYKYAFSMMYIPNVINTIALLILCNSAIKVTINILKQNGNLKSEFIRHSIVCIIMLMLLIVSTMVETYLLISLK